MLAQGPSYRKDEHALDKAITLRLLGQIVEVQVNDINGTERLKDLTNIVLAK